jgi:hypothetical protein
MKKYVYLNDIAIDSLNPRYDLHNNNGGHVKNVKNVEKSIKITKIQSLYGCLILLLSGDVSINPGPTKFPYGVCSKPVRIKPKRYLV